MLTTFKFQVEYAVLKNFRIVNCTVLVQRAFLLSPNYTFCSEDAALVRNLPHLKVLHLSTLGIKN
jgi:hypothetical protein